MIYLVIFMSIFIFVLLGFIVLQNRDLKKLGETLAELEIMVDDLKNGKIYP